MGGEPRSRCGVKGRGHVKQAAFYRKAVRFQKVGKTGGRLEFLIAQFRFGENGGGDLFHLRKEMVDSIQQCALFGWHVGHELSL